LKEDTLMTLEIGDAPLADAPGLAVRGEIDMKTAPALDDALADAIRDSDGALVFDLAGVSELFALYASREAALAALVPAG
jgi:hypothetical protein